MKYSKFKKGINKARDIIGNTTNDIDIKFLYGDFIAHPNLQIGFDGKAYIIFSTNHINHYNEQYDLYKPGFSYNYLNDFINFIDNNFNSIFNTTKSPDDNIDCIVVKNGDIYDIKDFSISIENIDTDSDICICSSATIYINIFYRGDES